MNDTPIQEVPEGRPLFDAAEFIRQSPLWREMQYDALKARLRGVAAAEGLQIVNLQRINQSVVGLTAYVGNQDERRTSLRCRSIICRLLRSAGVNVRKCKVFARYRRSVIRCVFAPDWD